MKPHYILINEAIQKDSHIPDENKEFAKNFTFDLDDLDCGNDSDSNIVR